MSIVGSGLLFCFWVLSIEKNPVLVGNFSESILVWEGEETSFAFETQGLCQVVYKERVQSFD